jgi:hypothetical protein
MAASIGATLPPYVALDSGFSLLSSRFFSDDVFVARETKFGRSEVNEEFVTAPKFLRRAVGLQPALQ